MSSYSFARIAGFKTDSINRMPDIYLTNKNKQTTSFNSKCYFISN